MNIVSLIFMIWLNFVSTANLCDIKYCNSHGLCILDGDGQMKCECVENVYYGERCENSVAFCDKNYCEDAKSCRDFPGGYKCKCGEGYGGQNCTRRSNREYINPLIGYNAVIRVNVEQYFVVFLEQLPAIDTMLHLSTYNYMIDTFQFSIEDEQYFQETANMQKIAKRNGIIDYDKVDGTRGYYTTVKYSLTKIMTYQIRLTFVNTQSEDEMYYWDFNVRAFEPELKCIPDIENYGCTDPKAPMNIAIDRHYTIAPIVKRNCGKNSKLTFGWSISDFLDKKVLHVFERYTRRQLNLLPYMMQFNDKSEKYHTLYIIKVYVDEQNGDGSKMLGRSYFRCYVKVIMQPPYAEIEGGTKREIPIGTKFILNGAQSRDLSQPATKSSTLEFVWICQSTDDPTNMFCAQLAATKSIITVPANTLTVGKTYKFTVTVKSKTTDKSNFKSQSITITTNDQTRLELNVICLKNCPSPVSANADLFLKGECISCNDRTTVQYKWELDNKIIGNRNRLVLSANYLTKNENYEILLRVEMNGMHGEYYYGFKTNEGIRKGACVIVPKTDGWALKTIYNITCFKFKSSYQPLEYKVYANERLVATSFNSKFGFRVRNNEDLLIVKVYDRYGELVTYDLKINNQPIDFKSIDEYDWLAQDNDVQGIAVMIECQINDLGKNSANKDEAIVYMLNTLKNIEYSPNTCDMELGTNTLVKLLNAFALDYDKALILFDVLTNYLTSLREFSYIDAILVTRDFVEILDTNYIKIMDKLYTEIVMIPDENYVIYPNDAAELKLYQDENYPEYPEFDFEAVIKIIQLEQIFNKTEQLYTILNRIVSKQLEVNETALFYENAMNIVKLFSVCDDDPDVENSLKISYPNYDIQVEADIFKLGNEVTVHTRYFKDLRNTPFWWLPKSEKQFTNIFMVQMTERTSWNNLPNANLPTINYRYKFDTAQRRRARNEVPLNKIENTIYNSSDIVVYQLSYNKNELLLINFGSSSPQRLQLAFKPNSEPNYNDFRHAKPVYIIENTERLIRLRYDKTFKIYMGIILAEDDDPSTDIPFSFTIELIACTQFDVATRRWCTQNCQTALNSTKTDVICSCTNQNTNLYSIYNKPKPIIYHNRYDRIFLRRLPINLTILIILLVLLILFICLLVIVILKTRHYSGDRIITNNVIVTDNLADHNYLLTIVCGSSGLRSSVTTSNIGIQIYGDQTTSDQYIFKLTEARNNSDNVYQFVLKSKNDFGDIKNVLLWIDYTGSVPSFDCDEIIITIGARTYRFYVYDRLSLQYRDTNLIKMVNINDKNKCKFIKLLQRNYYKNNLLANSCRNKMYLTLLLLRIVVIMLVCVLLMGRTTFDNYKNYSKIEINLLNIFICIVVVVILEKLIYYLYLKYKRAH